MILVDNDKLIGFISIFPEDCDECPELSPWYATMYVKKEYNDTNFTIISFVNYKIQNNTLFPLHLCRYMVKFFKYVTEV